MRAGTETDGAWLCSRVSKGRSFAGSATPGGHTVSLPVCFSTPSCSSLSAPFSSFSFRLLRLLLLLHLVGVLAQLLRSISVHFPTSPYSPPFLAECDPCASLSSCVEGRPWPAPPRRRSWGAGRWRSRLLRARTRARRATSTTRIERSRRALWTTTRFLEWPRTRRRTRSSRRTARWVRRSRRRRRSSRSLSARPTDPPLPPLPCPPFPAQRRSITLTSRARMLCVALPACACACASPFLRNPLVRASPLRSRAGPSSVPNDFGGVLGLVGLVEEGDV